MFKNSFLSLIVLLVVIFNLSLFAQEDIAKLREIMALRPSPSKLDSLFKFQKDFQSSQFLNRSNLELSYTYAGLKKTDSALIYAHKYIEALPPANRPGSYNSIAYTFAENEIGLDTALIYANRAIELMKSNPRFVNMAKDTKAYVLYKKGDAKAALEIQKETIPGNERNSEYLYHIALYYKETGNIEEALKYSARAALYSDAGAPLLKFNEWAKGYNAASKDELVMDIINSFVADAGKDSLLVKSNAAAFMAQTGINMAVAEQWADLGIKSINKKTKFEEYTSFKKNSAIVKTAQNKYDEALSDLLEIRDLIDPWISDYWLTLGKIYEAKNENDKAYDSYISGLAGYENPVILDAAKRFASISEIEKAVDKKKEQISVITPSDFNHSSGTTGKVVLAELFTGAECGPCIAADYAFEEISEHYPKEAVAILEYHVHIPGPDPLTNPETFQRYMYYGGDFGTPTAFFEGEEKITGGGPKTGTSNRFNVYSYSIKKYMNDTPAVKISGDAKLNGDNVEITIQLEPADEAAIEKPVLHIAIAEKSVEYTGANGVSNHIFAVRDLVDSTAGIPVDLSQDSEFQKSVSLKTLKQDITNYLTNPAGDQSWRGPFSGWRAEVNVLNKIDEKNLAIVAWVQDAETKKVIQAYYMDVN